ncbi:MAG: hypothetical protein LBJ43_03410, partial [Propionibacteriaceae bacterium]|nr:hypothetical protein [Propionibacteriaceae bacterium]
DVAEQIELLGLDATVVAGSSPQSVSLFVSDYFVDRSEMATDLGWVSQEWSSLGASVTVETALSGTVLMLVGVALLAGAVGMVVCAVTSAKGLRFSVGILRVIGWRERRILRLVAGELAPASLLVAVMGVGCFMWVPYQLRSLFAAGVVFAGVLFGAETVAALRPTRVRSGTSRDGEPVLSLRGVALRLLRSRAVWVGLIVVGVSLVAVLTTLGVVVVREGRERAGATRLAEFAFSATGSLTLGIEVLGVGAAILLLVLAHRMERLQAAGDTAVFNAVGFTLAAQAVIARWQEFLVAVGCAIAGLVVVSVVSVMFAGGWVAWLAGVGALVLVMMLRFVSSSNKTEVIR